MNIGFNLLFSVIVFGGSQNNFFPHLKRNFLSHSFFICKSRKMIDRTIEVTWNRIAFFENV